MRYKCVTNEPKYSIKPPFFQDFYKKARVIFLKTYYECITCVHLQGSLQTVRLIPAILISAKSSRTPTIP